MKSLCHPQLEYMKLIRRTIHQYPELSGKEFNTSEMVRSELEKMGIDFSVMAGTGIVGVIQGNKPGKTILVRADMDALAIQEKTGCDYSSKVPGVMHACAHDGHTACLLGVAKTLLTMKDKINGTVKLVFQPAEEYDFGARNMVEAGVLEDPKVDFALGHHLWGPMPKGIVGVRHGAVMAAPDVLSFTIKGNGGHGAMPDVCSDLILVASQAICMIYSRLQRKINVFEDAVLSICAINGGDSYNVLPDKVKAIGTIRTFNKETRNRVIKVVEDVLKCVTSLEGLEYELELDTDNGPLINDDMLVDIVKESATEVVGAEKVIEMKFPELGGEDFAYYSEKVPSCFFFVGISDDINNPVIHHSSDFEWDDDLLEVSCNVMVQSTLNILEKLSK